MKKIFFLLIVFGCINTSNSQTFIPLLQQGNKWNVAQNIGGSGIFYTEIFKLVNDTAYYNNKWWKKIYITTDSTANAIYTLKTYLREEANGKVYILDTMMQSRLYFDFAASLGDTLVLYNTYDIKMDTFVVSQVNMEVYGGLNRKKISISMGHYANDICYEGIGSRRGIVYGNPRIYVNSDIYHLLCFSQHELLIYQSSLFGISACYINDVGISDMDETQYSVFPNPATNSITFNTGMFKDFKLRIFNAIGQTVLQKQLSIYNTTINISNFQQGMYYYQLLNDKGKIVRGKFLKE